jgi:acetoin utilization deacetylase AcuC-like enzyme
MNVPVPFGTEFQEYMDAFQNKLKPVALRYKPDFVLISAGFDAHKDDPLSGIQLASSAYGHFTDVIREIADQTCDGKIVSVLEGGYNLKALSESVLEHLNHLS